MNSPGKPRQKLDEAALRASSDLQVAAIEKAVRSGKAVISGDDSTVVAMIMNAVNSGQTATFYVSRRQFNLVMRRHWTPDRVKKSGLKPVSDEEKSRIEAELGVKDQGSLYFNTSDCLFCGNTYGAYEFVQQGIAEHGEDVVGRILSLEDTSVIQVNPSSVAVCPKCGNSFPTGRVYEWAPGYGCCYEPLTSE